MSENKVLTSVNTPTQFVAASNGVRYGYRKIGSGKGLPLLFLQHFTGTMNNWDPSLTDLLATGRPVILFDNAGIGRSTGKPAETVAETAAHAFAFTDALGLEKIDLLGFSLGGMVAQEMVRIQPERIRKLVLAGTGPEGGKNMEMLKPVLMAIFTDKTASLGERMVRLFFSPTPTSEAAGRGWWQRTGQRTEDREPESGPEVFHAQAAAIAGWGKLREERFANLETIKHPVFVFNGNKDIMIPTENSFLLSQRLPNASLVILPDSGHGALFQYAELFAGRVIEFLDKD